MTSTRSNGPFRSSSNSRTGGRNVQAEEALAKPYSNEPLATGPGSGYSKGDHAVTTSQTKKGGPYKSTKAKAREQNDHDRTTSGSQDVHRAGGNQNANRLHPSVAKQKDRPDGGDIDTAHSRIGQHVHTRTPSNPVNSHASGTSETNKMDMQRSRNDDQSRTGSDADDARQGTAIDKRLNGTRSIQTTAELAGKTVLQSQGDRSVNRDGHNYGRGPQTQISHGKASERDQNDRGDMISETKVSKGKTSDGHHATCKQGQTQLSDKSEDEKRSPAEHGKSVPSYPTRASTLRREDNRSADDQSKGSHGDQKYVDERESISESSNFSSGRNESANNGSPAQSNNKKLSSGQVQDSHSFTSPKVETSSNYNNSDRESEKNENVAGARSNFGHDSSLRLGDSNGENVARGRSTLGDDSKGHLSSDNTMSPNGSTNRTQSASFNKASNTDIGNRTSGTTPNSFTTGNGSKDDDSCKDNKDDQRYCDNERGNANFASSKYSKGSMNNQDSGNNKSKSDHHNNNAILISDKDSKEEHEPYKDTAYQDKVKNEIDGLSHRQNSTYNNSKKSNLNKENVHDDFSANEDPNKDSCNKRNQSGRSKGSSGSGGFGSMLGFGR